MQAIKQTIVNVPHPKSNVKPILPAKGEKERWRYIPGWEGLYKISTFGRVKGVRRLVSYTKRSGKKITQSVPETIIRSYGEKYVQINLYRGSKMHHCYAHILSGKTFHKNPNNLPEVNHKDGNPQNNYYKNLEWNTRADNIQHSYDIGIRKNVGIRGSLNFRSKDVYQFSIDGKFIKKWGSKGEIQRETGFNASAVYKCCIGETKKSYGYKWSFSK